MEKHSLKKPKDNRTSQRVGRGGKRGKTSGKGMKGQKARTGNSTRPEMRDIIKKLPKRRGYGTNRSRTVVPNRGGQSVNLDQISLHFKNGAEVTPKALFALGLVRRESGRMPKIKILARGELTKKVVFKKVTASKSARELIEKVGGEITV